MTGVHYACQNGNVECLRLLIDNNADVDCKTENGETGLLMAVFNGHPKCVKVMLEAKADINHTHTEIGQGLDALLCSVHKKEPEPECTMVLLDYGVTDIPNAAYSQSALAPLASTSLLIPISIASKVQSLGAVLGGDEAFPISEQALAFMLLVHDADIDAATTLASKKRLRLASSMYANTHLFIERWHRIALDALSLRVGVDRRVGLGLNGLYQEPLERVLQYLGLSMDADQVVNSSLDGDDGVLRVLLPNCAHNADHWFQLHQQNKQKNATKRAKPKL
jgi:hypothetical protein